MTADHKTLEQKQLDTFL